MIAAAKAGPLQLTRKATKLEEQYRTNMTECYSKKRRIRLTAPSDPDVPAEAQRRAGENKVEYREMIEQVVTNKMMRLFHVILHVLARRTLHDGLVRHTDVSWILLNLLIDLLSLTLKLLEHTFTSTFTL